MRSMQSIRSTVGAAIVFTSAVGLCPSPVSAQASNGNVRAILELGQRFYYAGEPFPVRISIGNDGPNKVQNPVETPLFKGFLVQSIDGTWLPASENPGIEDPDRPIKLAPNAFYGTIVDLTRVYPDLRKPGRYEIRWSAGGVDSGAVAVKMIPRYDGSKEYVARLETTEGAIVIALQRDAAPFAVKNFVDLVHTGFYDGLTFHEVRADALIVSGDPTGTGSGGTGYTFPAELSRVAIEPGTVLMKPVSPSPLSNSSQFMIMLRPEPAWSGRFTVLGRVVEGLEVARKISKVTSTAESSRPFHRPLQDVRIREVTITERTAEGASP